MIKSTERFLREAAAGPGRVWGIACQLEVAEPGQNKARQEPVGHVRLAGDGHCTDMNGASVQPPEGPRHGMKITVPAEQMKVCVLKSLLPRASSSFKSRIVLMGGGREGSAQQQNCSTGRRSRLSFRCVSASGSAAAPPPGRLSPAPGAPCSAALRSVFPLAVPAAPGTREATDPSLANTAVPGPNPGGRGEAGCPVVTPPRKILLKQHFKWQHDS